MNRTEFENATLKEKLRHKGQQHLKYNLEKWVWKGNFDTLNGIGENITLV